MIMISTLSRVVKPLLGILIYTFSFVPAEAQTGQTLSVSPALYDLAVSPGQQLESSIRVINPNPYDLTVYLEVVNFRPRGEGGDGQFIPIGPSDTLTKATLAEWFALSAEPISIPQGTAVEVPFKVVVPGDASPGGHFAAILVGTRPLTDESDRSKIQTNQIISSLFFVRVAGEVIESGMIREFTTTDNVYSRPQAEFLLRFENRGNVHLQPQGEIKIINMWGKERGTIPINQYSNFGNVLPDSIRQYRLVWSGEWSHLDIGRYTAVITLAYGLDERRFVSSEITFWVLPLGIIAQVTLGVLVFITLLIWLMRWYVKRMLRQAGVDLSTLKANRPLQISGLERNSQALPRFDLRTRIDWWRSRLVSALENLLSNSAVTPRFRERLALWHNFLRETKLWYAIVAIGLLVGLGLYLMFNLAGRADHRPYTVGYLNSDQTIEVNSEEIIYNQLRADQATATTSPTENNYPITIINRSGTPGLGAKARLHLEAAGYQVSSLRADFSDVSSRTVVIAPTTLSEAALEVSALFDSAPVSLIEEQATDEIIIYLGSEAFTE